MATTCFLCVDSVSTNDNLMQSHCGCDFHCNCLQQFIITTNKSDECPQCGAKYFSTGLHIAQNGLELANYPKESTDYLCVFAAVSQNGLAIIHASLSLQQNLDIIIAAINNNPIAINLVKSDLITQEMLIDCIQRGNDIDIPQSFEDNNNVALAQVTKDGLLLKDISIVLQDDYDIIMAAVSQNGLALEFVDGMHFMDQQIIETAVTQNGLALKFAAPFAKKMPRIVHAALKSNVMALQYVDESIRSHKKFQAYLS